ncbi:MAG TPA: BglII/BstYI family type II restriction endonuclease [Terriglobales bacterium]|nr:BglII/BstYI family type II restriction endonuclease [Terriglobales bacterium]
MKEASRLFPSALRLQRFSFRFAEQVLNSKLALKEEIEQILLETIPDIAKLSRPAFNKLLNDRFVAQGWTSQPSVFDDPNDPGAKMDFLKGRIDIEVGFGHASFIGIDLLKFQVSSYSALDKINVGVYIVTASNFQKFMKAQWGQNWEGIPYVRKSQALPAAL